MMDDMASSDTSHAFCPEDRFGPTMQIILTNTNGLLRINEFIAAFI